jgi:hypothetical protein
MIRSLRTGLFALFMVGSIVVAGSAVSAATTTATLAAGTLAITAAPANFSYSGTLNGDVLNLGSSFAVGVNDPTGSKAGWQIQATASVLTSGTDTIPAAAHTIQSVAVTGTTGTAPVNGVSYPMALPTTAAKIFNSAATKGMGKSTETFTTQLAVPADAASGTYSATLTVTIVAGP